METLNWQNKKWMEFFNENRHLWSPIASEWERLSKIYINQYERTNKKNWN